MHYTAEERATFVRWHYAHGCIVKQTANHFRISRDTVSRWLAVRRGQRPNYSNATRTAPARKITAKDVRYIKRAAKTQLPEVITHRLNIIRAKEGRAPVCKKTVVRVITGTRQPMKLLGPLKVKVVSPVNMKRRVKYCKSPSAKAIDYKVYVDSKTCRYSTYYQKGNLPSYQYPTKRRRVGTCKEEAIIHVYGAISLGWRSRLVLTQLKTKQQIAHNLGIPVDEVAEPAFGAADAQEALAEIRRQARQHFKRRHIKFVIDLASQHTAVSTLAWMKAQHFPMENTFPPASPDLNPIENVWAMLDQKLLGMPIGKPQQWGQTVQKAWAAIPQSNIDNCIKALPKRARMVTTVGGERLASTHTK
jgi:transposase